MGQFEDSTSLDDLIETVLEKTDFRNAPNSDRPSSIASKGFFDLEDSCLCGSNVIKLDRKQLWMSLSVALSVRYVEL